MDGNSGHVHHIESGLIAAYLDGTLTPGERASLEAHAATCDACRAELVDAARLVRTLPRRPGWRLPLGTAAAAVIALLLFAPHRQAAPPDVRRELVVSTTVGPTLVSPRGASAGRRLTWTRVPRADRYWLTVFDSTGNVVWDHETADSAAVIPDSVHLGVGAAYLWKVEAQTEWGRRVASELVEFTFEPATPAPAHKGTTTRGGAEEVR